MANRDQLALFPARRKRAGRTRRSADVTVKALREHGRLERVDEALVVAHRAAADNVDLAELAAEHGEGSPFVVANAIRTYLMATAALYARVGIVESDADDDIWRALSAPVVDPPSA
jgi:hypothetical protein